MEEVTSQGIHASKEDLMKCFGTSDTTQISRIILDKGTEQISGKEREHLLQRYCWYMRMTCSISTEVATLISEMCYNPDTDAVFTVWLVLPVECRWE